MLGLAGIFHWQDFAEEKCKEMFGKLGRLNPKIKKEDYILLQSRGSTLIVSSLMKDITGNPGYISQNGKILIGINGELFNLDELLDFRIAKGDISPAEKIYHLYKKNGLKFVEKLIGSFSIVIEDKEKNTIQFISDRYGLKPLYYTILGKSVFYATKVKAIADVLPEKPVIDSHGMADFILLGMPTGIKTLRKNISLIPPASIISIKDGAFSVQKYWELKFNSSKKIPESLNHYVNEFSNVFERAVERTFDNEISYDLPLSGGMDSRCILAAASEKKSIRTYTLGSKGSPDLLLGHEVAQLFEIENKQFEIKSEDFLNWIPDSVYITDGMYNPIHAPILHIARQLPHDARVVIDGINSFDGFYRFPELLFSRKIIKEKDLVNTYLSVCPEPIINENFTLQNNLIDQGFFDSNLSYLKNNIDLSVKKSLDITNNYFDVKDHLDQSNRTQRYNIMGSVLLRSVCEVRTPLFDQQLIDKVLDFNRFYRSKEKFVMGHYLSKINPAAAKIIYERTGLPAHAGVLSHLNKYSKTVMHRTFNKLTHRRNIPHVAIDFYSFFTKDKMLQDYFRDILLHPQFINQGYVRTDNIEPFLNNLFNGKMENMGLAGRLLTLELWDRYQ